MLYPLADPMIVRLARSVRESVDGFNRPLSAAQYNPSPSAIHLQGMEVSCRGFLRKTPAAFDTSGYGPIERVMVNSPRVRTSVGQPGHRH